MIKGIGQTPASRVELGRTPATTDGKPVSRTEAMGRALGTDTESSAIATIVAAGPPVDTDKVARIKAQIADGSYAINPRAIADKMIQHDLGE